MSRTALGARSCSIKTSGIEVLLRAILVGPGVSGPSLEDCVKGMGRQKKLLPGPGEHETANAGDGGSFRESLQGEGSRVQFPGIVLDSVVFARCQAVGKRHSQLMNPHKGHFTSCSAF